MGGAVAAVAAPVVGGIVGNIAGKSDRSKAEGAIGQALAEINAVGAPPDLSKEIIKEKFKQVGILTPDLEKAIDVGVTEVSKIQEDNQLREAQTQSLKSLQEIGEGGITAIERGALDKIRNEAALQGEAKRQQIQQNLQARGLGGAGAELASQLSAAQGNANTEALAGSQVAAQAQQRALEAISRAGQLGGNIRSQDFNVNQARAEAADELQRFNLAQQIGRQERNINRANVAEQSNLKEKQNIANINTQQINDERLRQAEAKRQQFLDKLDLASARSGAERAKANFFQNKAAGKAATFGKIGSGLQGGILGAQKAGLFDSSSPVKKITPGESITPEAEKFDSRLFDIGNIS